MRVAAAAQRFYPQVAAVHLFFMHARSGVNSEASHTFYFTKPPRKRFMQAASITTHYSGCPPALCVPLTGVMAFKRMYEPSDISTHVMEVFVAVSHPAGGGCGRAVAGIMDYTDPIPSRKARIIHLSTTTGVARACRTPWPASQQSTPRGTVPRPPLTLWHFCTPSEGKSKQVPHIQTIQPG